MYALSRNSSGKRLFIIGIGLVTITTIFLLQIRISLAQVSSPCHLLTKSQDYNPLPQPLLWLKDFVGKSYDVFNPSHLYASVTCPLSSLPPATTNVSLPYYPNFTPPILTIQGSSPQYQILWHEGYIQKENTSQWEKLTFSGTPYQGYTTWNDIGNSAQLLHTLSSLTQQDLSNTTALLFYICTWNGTRWACGCENTQCATPKWQLQGVHSFGGGVSNKQESLFTDPGLTDKKMYLSPINYNGSLYGPVGIFGGKPRWHVAQWGIGGIEKNITNQLSAQTEDLGGGAWKTENTHARVQYNSDGTYNLRLDSTNVNTGCMFPPSEIDLFIQANENRGTSASIYPEGFAPEGVRPTLAQINSLRFKTIGRVVSASHFSRCGSNQDLATALVSIIVHSDVAGRGLFYQIVFYDSRGVVFDGSSFPESFAVSDSVQVLGKPALTAGGPKVTYDIEIANALKRHILNLNIDNNLNNWKVFGFAIGNSTNGGGKISSEFSNIDLVVEGDF